ncbi:MAG: hypothetical protein HOY71_24090 [Nonomuraea sp.]|nr:hypothetical protein [Nonomuraea sp.]
MEHLASLRHFRDLRDGDHGGAVTRADKERLFARAVTLLDPVARQVLDEVDSALLLGTGHVSRRAQDAGLTIVWGLTWREQRDAGVQPVMLIAHYGRSFHHPHLRGGTVGDWPLNVFTPADAQAELPTLRAIATADVHNLVFQANYRLIPAITTRP